MIKWRKILSLALLLALFLAPLMQAAAMTTMADRMDLPAMAEPMSASSDTRHEGHGSHDAHPDTPPEAQMTSSMTSSECHGNAGMLDCCAHCGGCGIPISIRFASGATGVEYFAHYGMHPQPVLDPQKRPPRRLS